jgi:peptidoglycan/xylan/chitin deacetylase (PgdA/CDA1 family)
MKSRYLLLIAVVLIPGCAMVCWRISRSTTFQFFGEIVPRVDTTQRVVALTFDDGPAVGATDQILATLHEEQVPATFFLIGGELEQNLAEGRKIAAAGHEIGNHSYSHERMLLVTPSFVKQEIESTDKLIRAAGYQGEILFRPPYGKKLFALPYYLSKTGRKTIMWDVDPDANPDNATTSEKIAEYVVSKTRPGSIIILHVMYSSRVETMKAVKKIIEDLKQQGYSFKTVSELLTLR